MGRRIPKYRCYKPKNLGLVVIDGRQHYLGKYGTPESVARYNRLIQEWLASGGVAQPRTSFDGTDSSAGRTPTVNELILAFWTRHAEVHYRHPDGTPTGELGNYRDSLRPLRRLYGLTPAHTFGPLALKAVRQAMIDGKLARTTINQRIGRIVRLFKWAAENELVPVAVYQGLRAVAGLRRGRSAAREPEPVGPVPEEHVVAIRPQVARQVWAMIELQRLTAMRPGEVVVIRGCDLDTSREAWVYTPERHKTAHRGHTRSIFLGPRAREVLRPWLREDLEAYLFSPREAVAERRATGHRRRPGEAEDAGERTSRSQAPGRPPGERYTTRTYHHAVARACARAGVPRWHPNQLRHAAATRLRREHGLEVARLILGHRSAATTEIYAEADRFKAMEVMIREG